MKMLLLIGFGISLTICLSTLLVIPNKQVKIPEILTDKLSNIKSINKLLIRSNVPVDIFILIHFVAVVLMIYQQFKTEFLEIMSWNTIKPLMLILPPFYLWILSRNSFFRKMIIYDVEEIQRITHFLERTGTTSKNINLYLAQTIKGPLGAFVKKLATASMVSIDIENEYKALKDEFKDIREVVNYANIGIQKQMTGKSDELLQQQLDQIMQVKTQKYKMKRVANRTKLIVLALLLLGSFLSVTLYPLGQAFMNDLIKSMSS